MDADTSHIPNEFPWHPSCPNCRGSATKRGILGLPTPELFGCTGWVRPPDKPLPEWICGVCNHEWSEDE